MRENTVIKINPTPNNVASISSLERSAGDLGKTARYNKCLQRTQQSCAAEGWRYRDREEQGLLVKRLVLESKPINLYGYTIILYGAVCGIGLLIPLVTKDFKPGVLPAIVVTMLVPLLNYLYRFYRSRNNKKVRQRLEETESHDEAWSLVFGGAASGFVLLAVMGATLYFSIKVLVL